MTVWFNRLRFTDRVFETMETVDRHVYQILTKRGSLMRNDLFPEKVTTSNRIFLLVLTTRGSTDEAEALLGRTDHRHFARA